MLIVLIIGLDLFHRPTNLTIVILVRKSILPKEVLMLLQQALKRIELLILRDDIPLHLIINNKDFLQGDEFILIIFKDGYVSEHWLIFYFLEEYLYLCLL